MDPLRLAVTCLRAYPALMDGKEMFGGGERHSVLLSNGLAERGHAVSLLTLDPGPGKPLHKDGVEVVPMYSLHAGIPGVQFWHPRLTGTLRAYKASKPQLVIQPIQSPLAGITAWMARRENIPWIHMITSDQGVDGTYHKNANFRDRQMYQWGLHRATAIVAQTYFQKRNLEQNYGITATVIRNPTVPINAVESRAEYVVWVGQLFPIKRPELLLEIAQKLPNIQFKAAGTETGKLSRDLVRALESAPNIELLGQVPSSEMSALYQGAGLFLSTSRWEGLSNAFLEAWQHGLPVCSLAADPDGIIGDRAQGENSIGVVEPDISQMVKVIQRLMVDQPEDRVAMGRQGMLYVRDNHDPEVVISQWEEVIANCF